MPKHVDSGPPGADDAAQRLRTILRQTYLKRFSLQIETVSVSPREKPRNGSRQPKRRTGK
jgi:hypothetical protein